jgi:transposase
MQCVAMFRLQLSRQVQLNMERKQLDETAQRLLAENADFRRLLTLPGIGAIMALTILAEAGDLRRFGHHRQFLSYCGLDLCKTQSGQSRGRETLSRTATNVCAWFSGLPGCAPYICVKTHSATSMRDTCRRIRSIPIARNVAARSGLE